MKSQTEFADFYNQNLKKDVERMESRRLRISKLYSYRAVWKLTKWLLILSVAVSIYAALFPEKVPMYFRSAPFAALMFGIVGVLIVFIGRMTAFKPIAREYKTIVVPKIIACCGDSFSHKEKEGITQEEFSSGSLFSAPTGMTFKSDNLVEGRSDTVRVRLSNMSAKLTTTERYRDDETGVRENTHTHIFTGLYAICQREKKAPFRIVISKRAEPVAEEDESKKTSIDKSDLNDFGFSYFRTGDAEFDQYFVVKGDNEEELKQLISKEFIGLLKALGKELTQPIRIAFFGDQVHVAFSGAKIFFTDAHLSFLEPEITKKYFNYISYVIGMSKAL